MSRVLTRVVLVLLAGGFVLALALLALLPSSGEERAQSSFSTRPDGLRAAYLVLQGLGFDVAPWSAAPGALAGRGELLVLTELPTHPPASPAPRAGAPDTAPVPAPRSRDVLHYRRFLDEGGALLVTGVRELELAFLRETLELEGLDDLASEELPGEPAPGLVLERGEELELDKPPARHLVGAPAPGDEVLARARDGSIVALARAAGAGRLVLLTLPASTFDNESLQENEDAARLLVRLVESVPEAERILFDEYALGGWEPESALGLAFSARLAWWSTHLLLLVLVVFWRSAWAGPFARDPEPLLAVSPLARAQGFARLLARAGRFDTLARLLTQGTLERWMARVGLRLVPGHGEGLEPAVVLEHLRALTRGDERLLARARASFLERVPADADELARLDRELSALERQLFRRPDGRKTRRGIGTRVPSTRS